MKKIVIRFGSKNNSGFRYFWIVVLFVIWSALGGLSSGIYLYAAEAGSSAFTFLRIGEGAKPAGMGEAYIALADDVNSIYWNPAGLGRVRQQEIMVSYLSYVVDINSGYFGYVLPTSVGGLGIGVIYLDYGKIEETTEDNPVGEGYYRPHDMAVIASYGCKINSRFSLGMSMKGIYEKIQDYTANGVAVDLGTIYEVPVVRDLSIGFTVKNLGLQTKAFIEEKHDLPLLFDIGLGYSMFSKSLRLGLDLYKPQEGDFNVNVGGEYNWKGLAYLRTGYRSMGEDLKTGSGKDSLTGFCVGLGLNMKMYQMEYAFVPFNELGYTHRVSLGMKWGEIKVPTSKSQVPSQKTKIKKQRVEGMRHYKKGQRYCKEGNYRKAVDEYKKAIKEGYKKASVYANMGYCYHKLGKKIAARKYYKKALELDPNNKKIKKNLEMLSKK